MICCKLQEASNQIANSYDSMTSSFDESMAVHDTGCADNDMAKSYMNMRMCNPPQMMLGVGATGTMFRLQFLGSVEVEEEGGKKRRKRMKKSMVEEAVVKIKVRIP